MPVSEADAMAVLPSEGWLRTYVIHAARQTTSPLIYHFGVGLTLLAVSTPLSYGMHYAGTLRANQFCLLVGRSGEDQKTTALNVGKEILDAAAPELIGDYPGSAQGLIDSLSKRHTQVIPIGEFGKFLSQAQNGYFEQLKTLLADLWDAGPVQRALAGGDDKVVRVPSPRLSLAAACSIPYLEKHTLAEDWTGGFMGRWCVLYGRRERTDPDPHPDRSLFDPLCEDLRRRALIPSVGWCKGLTPSARLLWNEWFHSVSNRANLPNNIIGIRARAPAIARKVALAYAWDFGDAAAQEGKPWALTPEVLEPAIAFTELHISSLVGLSDVIAEHPEARLRRNVIMAIEAKGGVATLGEILRILKMKKRAVVEHLDALIEEATLAKVATTLGEITYELRGEAPRFS